MNLQKKPWVREAGIVLLLLASSLLILYPMLGSFSSRLPFAKNGDVRLSLSILDANLRNVTHGKWSQVYHLPIVFPYSYVMTSGVNLFGQTLLSLPLYLAGIDNPYLWYNLLTLLAYLAAGYCAYRLILELVGSRPAALTAAILYILLPFRVHNIPQLNLLFSFAIPLAFLFFWRYLKERKTRDLFLFVLSLLGQFLFDLSLGLFLAIALGFFLLFYLLFCRERKPLSLIVSLLIAGLLFSLATVAIFHPYLQKATSFSQTGEVTAIGQNAYHSAVSFYANWSYLLLFLKKVIWRTDPYSGGLFASIFFLIAFWPAVVTRPRKIAFGVSVLTLLLPAILIPALFRVVSYEALTLFAEISLVLALSSLVFLALSGRRQLGLGLVLVCLTWAALLLFSSQVAFRYCNFFQLLSRLFPFLLRARGIRTPYITLLLFLAISAFGFRFFLEKRRPGKVLLLILLVLLVGERLRWPISMEKLEDDRAEYRTLYRQLDAHPDQFGLLELPFAPQWLNRYPLFTRYHRKHTYHGLIMYLSDAWQLQESPAWAIDAGYPGLADPAAIGTLRRGGLRYILLFRNRISSELIQDRRRWYSALDHIARGNDLGLYRTVAKSQEGILLVLAEREEAATIERLLPRFAFSGRRELCFTLSSSAAATVQITFNGERVRSVALPPGVVQEVKINIRGLRLLPQSNRLAIGAERPVVFDDLSYR